MNEVIKKLKDAGNQEAFGSPEKFRAAAAELGFSEKDIEEAIVCTGGFPIDDDALEAVTGGMAINRHPSSKPYPIN